MNIVKQDLLHKKHLLKILWSKVWKGGFQLMLILGLLGMYFDAVVNEPVLIDRTGSLRVVVFVNSQTLLLKLAMAILCLSTYH